MITPTYLHVETMIAHLTGIDIRRRLPYNSRIVYALDVVPCICIEIGQNIISVFNKIVECKTQPLVQHGDVYTEVCLFSLFPSK